MRGDNWTKEETVHNLVREAKKVLEKCKSGEQDKKKICVLVQERPRTVLEYKIPRYMGEELIPLYCKLQRFVWQIKEYLKEKRNKE